MGNRDCIKMKRESLIHMDHVYNSASKIRGKIQVSIEAKSCDSSQQVTIEACLWEGSNGDPVPHLKCPVRHSEKELLSQQVFSCSFSSSCILVTFGTREGTYICKKGCVTKLISWGIFMIKDHVFLSVYKTCSSCTARKKNYTCTASWKIISYC